MHMKIRIPYQMMQNYSYTDKVFTSADI